MLRCGQRQLDLQQPQVMGVLNITPDSFYDGGRLASMDAVLAQAQAMVAAGAFILDVGGESTRPGASPVSLSEECDRVLPVIEALLAEFEVVVSVDTRHTAVMESAIALGVHMINDVNALQADGALAAVAASQVAVCLMHMQGEPQTMQDNPDYQNVVAEVQEFLRARVAACQAAGIANDRLLVDPGFGFGKRLSDNLALLKGLKRLAEDEVPLLVGVSRKSMFQQLLNLPIDERMTASIAAAIWAVQQGACIVRTHDVKETVEALKVLQAIKL